MEIGRRRSKGEEDGKRKGWGGVGNGGKEE